MRMKRPGALIRRGIWRRLSARRDSISETLIVALIAT